MFGIVNAELQGIDLDVYVPNFEDGAPVLVGGHKMHSSGQSRTTDKNICNSRILYPREPGFLAEVECDFTHIRLHLGECDGKFMVMFVGNGLVRAELHIVVGFDGDDVREEIAALERQVLDDEIKRIVGILDTRDGDVSNLGSVQLTFADADHSPTYLVDEGWHDDLSNI